MLKKFRKIRKFKIEICFVLVLAVYLAYAIINQQAVLSRNEKEIAVLSEQLSQAETTLEELDDSVNLYSSDQFVERVARDRLGLVRPDETVFIDVTNE